jgi:8-oxo-dGTP pyrophosphatase MutT (NUDIX family)
MLTSSSTIFCNNCGQRGHPFRECKEPVLSCGILLLRNHTTTGKPTTLPTAAANIEVLMVRRKDSMSFAEFVRGKYDPAKLDYVRTLLSNMTRDEIARLKGEEFESIWAKLWGNSIIERREQEFHTACEKFRAVRPVVEHATSTYTEPEWGFPKGRRLKCETDQGCAEREFWEETNILRSEYCIVSGLQLEETFNGTNGIPYRHKYFVAVLTKPHDITQKFTFSQRQEISAIEWKTLDECLKLTRPQYVQRGAVIHDLANIVQTFEVRLPHE